MIVIVEWKVIRRFFLGAVVINFIIGVVPVQAGYLFLQETLDIAVFFDVGLVVHVGSFGFLLWKQEVNYALVFLI